MSASSEKPAMTIDEMRALMATAAVIRPRELHARNRETLLRITGAEIQAGAVTGVHMVSGLPVLYDDTMLPDHMDLRDSDTGKLLRRWILRENGKVLSVDVSRLGELFDL